MQQQNRLPHQLLIKSKNTDFNLSNFKTRLEEDKTL